MTAVSPADTTASYIRQKVRALTASSSESALTTARLDQYINNFYNNDFPYSIKIDQQRSVYTFYTEPYRDRYPLDVNNNMGLRAPVYVEGILGTLFKDRTQFFNLWPKWPTKFTPISGNGTQKIYSFTIPAPFLSKEVVLGGIDNAGNPISVADDGNGNLQLQVPNAVVTVPPYTDVYTVANAPVPALVGKPIPGMHNQNTLNPGLNRTNTATGTYTNAIGTVNYTTGVFNIEFPLPPAAGTQITLWVSQYQPRRPYCMLYWNNELTIRPVPKLIHKIEVESYLTPIQFMQSTDNPILNQWAKYIAYGAAVDILNDRNDFDGANALEARMMKLEGQILERQGIEEIGTPNYQLFNSTQAYSVYGGYYQGFY